MHDFVSSYDQMILRPDMRSLYGGSDFYNVGDWSRGAQTLSQACRHLAERHLDADSRQMRILDVGCGLGAATGLIAGHYSNAHVIGINVSPLQASHAQSNHPAAVYSAMDAARLGFPAASFDHVISIEAAFHFRSRESFFREAYRVLRAGGRMTLSDILFRTTEWVGAWSVPAANSLPDVDSYADLCRACGFEIEAIEEITNSTWSGFCRFLRTSGGYETFASRLEESVVSYLLVRLRKPI